MEQVYEWGIAFIHGIQKIRCVPLDLLAQVLHVLFNSPIYIAIFLYVAFCVDIRKARRIGVSLFISQSISNGLKNTLQVPRPYTRDPSIGLATESSWSTPSGHSGSAASVFPVLAKYASGWKKWVRVVVGVCVPLLIGISRCYLGVHYPTDVVLGLGLGFITALGVILFYDQIESKLSGLRLSVRILVPALITFVLISFDKVDASMAGGFFGLEAGCIMLSQKGGFNASEGTVKQKALRFLLGGAITMGAYFLMKVVFPSEGEMRALFRFIRYGGCAFIGMFICPVLFIRLKLGVPEKAAE